MNKNSVITLRIDDALKQKFKEQCEANGQNMSKVIELMIKRAIQENNKKIIRIERKIKKEVFNYEKVKI
ncbi:MAG: type II toxin-antitoxin system RelB/DinJ family antitoxin [Clostridium paraputrificum]|uniref:type II toxin-antitoxin system RelB/DinJ family antitoxin n=1 Tax=Clostridium paraputrificum TaxID=29363 RepID=UPI000C0738C2|nr:type II toxin-antitoxin system RelB/DinJ family antitoxin [Clostridium paraputrificum]